MRHSVGIVSHRGANPNCADRDHYEVWTKHNIQAIQKHVGKVLPFFLYSNTPGSQELWARYHSSYFVFEGFYRIASVQVHEGSTEAVRLFMEMREDSQRPRPKERWRAMMEARWCRAVLVRAPDVEQGGNPMITQSYAHQAVDNGWQPTTGLSGAR